jgi:hypothetical protein
MLAGNTLAVRTEMPDRLEEWRVQLQIIRADFAGRSDDWAMEVAFVDALLAVLNGESPALPGDNPYAGVVGQVVDGIAGYK